MKILSKSKSQKSHCFVNKSPIARRVRQRSADLRNDLIEKFQQILQTDQVKQYMRKHKKGEPCSNCIQKAIREDPKLRHKRTLLQPNIVQLETKDDYINNQRCLYLDRTLTTNLDKGMVNIGSLELMRQDILEKEKELMAIGDAQKVTAKDINMIHQMIMMNPMAEQYQRTLNELQENETRIISKR